MPDLRCGSSPLCIAVLLMSLPLAAQDPAPQPGALPPLEARAQEPPTAASAEPRAWLRGQLSTRYWLRWTGQDTDQDLYGTLQLDLGDPEQDRVSGYFLGRAAWDMDGVGPETSPFYSSADTWEDSVTGYVYEAYADLNRVDGFAVLRAGRMSIYETPEVAFFDGARAETAEFGSARWQFGAYGGVSTHLYESSADGDWTAGGYAQVRPWDRGRLRFDYMHLEDEARLGHENDLLGFGWWQRIGEHVAFDTQYTRIEDRDRDVRAHLQANLPEETFTANVGWYQLLTTQRDLVLELDPFYDALRDYYPFWQLTTMATKGLLDDVDLTLGFDLRRVEDDADIGEFNRDYERYYGTFGFDNLLVDALRLSVTADVWSSDGQDVQSWGLDLTKRFGAKDWLLSVGTYYALYKYDLFLNRESDDVRTYYGRVRHRIDDSWGVNFAYEYEDNDFDGFHFLRLEASWRF